MLHFFILIVTLQTLTVQHVPPTTGSAFEDALLTSQWKQWHNYISGFIYTVQCPTLTFTEEFFGVVVHDSFSFLILWWPLISQHGGIESSTFSVFRGKTSEEIQRLTLRWSEILNNAPQSVKLWEGPSQMSSNYNSFTSFVGYLQSFFPGLHMWKYSCFLLTPAWRRRCQCTDCLLLDLMLRLVVLCY